MRTDALAAIENRIDKSIPGDTATIFDILRDDSNPDKVRGVAMARFGELPKETIVPKLWYSLFDKKWQLRLDAARMILKTVHRQRGPLTSCVILPPNDRTKMGLSEPITLRSPHPRDGSRRAVRKPRDVLNHFLGSPEMGRQAHRGRLVLHGEEVGGDPARCARRRPDAPAKVRPCRPMRLGVPGTESARVRRQGCESHHDDWRVREVVRRAVVSRWLELCKSFEAE